MEDELIQEFINESREHLLTIEADLLAIEEAGIAADDQLLNKVFRAAHSIKGAAGFFDLTKVRDLAHKAETVLDMLRSRKMVANAEITNVLLRAFDKLRELINSHATSEQEDISVELDALHALACSYTPLREKPALVTELLIPNTPIPVVACNVDRFKKSEQFLYRINLDLIHDIDRKDKNALQVFNDFGKFGEVVDCRLDFESVGTLDGPVFNSVPLDLIFATRCTPEEICAAFDICKEQVSLISFESLSAVADPSDPNVRAALPAKTVIAQPQLPVAVPSTRETAVPANATVSSIATTSDDTLRVNVGLLDTLMNLAGELVLSRNQFQAAIAHNNHRMLTSAGQRLSQVTSEIQDAIMHTRLQPIENVFSRLPRVVRDLSSSLSKEVKLEVQGKDVALDRSLVEGLSDPLNHMVRNAIDHGIESPQVRIAAGKPSAGTLRVEARHEAGQVVIEISDDGSGINHERVAKAALSKGLITQEQLKGMSTDEQAALILLPGLSTAEKVTQVSGRGVGMDVVKTNLDRLGGQIEITSKRGEGTLFRIKLPLTLTIIPALIVSVGQERFAIPQIGVEELLRIRNEDKKRRIEVIGDTDVLVLRDRILPLLRLDDFLGVGASQRDADGVALPERRLNVADRRSPRHSLEAADEDVNSGSTIVERRQQDRRRGAKNALEIAVVNTGTFRYGLIVEKFHNTEEIVVKPLGRDLKESREYAGATILGDGAVALILDIGGLATKAELSSVSASPRAREHAEASLEESERLQQIHSFLSFRNGLEEQCAVPLEIVRRIEKIKGSQVENKGRRRTMQYREHSLPLVTLSDVAAVEQIDNARELAVIVSSLYGREVGLLAAMPVDVLESNVTIDTTTHRQPGISGSTVIHGETTLLVDLMELVDVAYPEWHKEQVSEETQRAVGKPLVLLAEDSDFFRAQIKRFLERDGCDVIAAVDGEDAWTQLLNNLKKVQVVVTDIEMPRLSGLGLALRIRADERTRQLPIIAVSSLAGEDDMAKATAAGVNEYQVKLDRDTLSNTVRQMMTAASLSAESVSTTRP